jgi:hypothetical protein
MQPHTGDRVDALFARQDVQVVLGVPLLDLRQPEHLADSTEALDSLTEVA